MKALWSCVAVYMLLGLLVASSIGYALPATGTGASSSTSDKIDDGAPVSDTSANDNTPGDISGVGAGIDVSSTVTVHSLSLGKAREGEQDSEILMMKMRSLPRVAPAKISLREISQQKKQSQDTISKITGRAIERISITPPETSTCHSAQTEFTHEDIFDCSEGIARLDTKETPLYSGMGKEYAYIETSLGVPDDADVVVLRLVHETEFQRQQEASIFYREQEVWKPLCHNLKEGTSNCDITRAARGKEKIDMRVEGYAREGASQWSVNSISLLAGHGITPKDEDADPIVIKKKDQDHEDFIIPGLKDTTNDETTDGDGTTFDGGFPLKRSIGSPSVIEETSFEEEVNPQGELIETPEEASTSTPIAGAAIGRFLRENRASLGLLLLVLAVVGSMVYQRRDVLKKKIRRLNLFSF